MMEEIPVNPNFTRAEDFLKNMADDEEKQEEPAMTLRGYLPKRTSLHNSFSGLGSTPISVQSGNASFSGAPRRQSGGDGGILQSLWHMKNPFGVDQSVNLMDSSLARYSSSYESTPMGEGRMIGRTSSNRHSFGMEDVYLDEASKRGGTRKKGGVNAPFYDKSPSARHRKRRAYLFLALVGLFFAIVGVFATVNFFLQSNRPNTLPAENSTSVDEGDSTPGVGGDEPMVQESPPAGEASTEEEPEEEAEEVDELDKHVEEDFEEEIEAIQEEEEDVEKEAESASSSKEEGAFEKEEAILEDMEHVVSESMEVVEAEHHAINEEDEDLLKKEETNLSHQEDNMSQQANLIEEFNTAETPADAKEFKHEEKMLKIKEVQLEDEQQEILKKEAKAEGWDYGEALKEANENEEGGDNSDEDGE